MLTANLESDLQALAATLRASTVAVRSRDGGGSGSGVVWSPHIVVTNAHVATSREVDLDLPDGRRTSARVERRDERSDLAALRIDDAGKPAGVRDPAEIRSGELLVAFGHPLGVSNVLSAGIAFAPFRAATDRFVRADIRLAPGNSGGALADSAGRVVGINSMVAGGLALAVAATTVRAFLGIQAPGRRLGVRVAPVELRTNGRAYAVLAVEPHGDGERSGIIVGDILCAPDLRMLVGAAHVTVRRGARMLTIALDRRSDGDAAAA